MRYKVLRNCHGFLGRYWKKATIVDSSQYQDKWPEDEKEIPRHFLLIDENGLEIVRKPKSDRMSMTEFSTNNAEKPETVSNQSEPVYDDPEYKKNLDNKKPTKKASKR